MKEENSPQGQAETDRPEAVKLQIEISPGTFRSALQLVAEYSGGTLEEVLAGLAGDLAEAWNRPGSWEEAAACGWLSSHPWPTRPVDDDLFGDEGGDR